MTACLSHESAILVSSNIEKNMFIFEVNVNKMKWFKYTVF